jgi:hypothetical protein
VTGQVCAGIIGRNELLLESIEATIKSVVGTEHEVRDRGRV